MKMGWYFNVQGIEYFIESNRKNKTRQFAEKILEHIGYPITEGNIRYILSNLVRANLEVKWCEACPDFGIQGHYYYNIFGNGFSGYGSNDINDGKTIIISVI